MNEALGGGVIQDSTSFSENTELVATYEALQRKIYRHESNQGSIIEIDYWGRALKLFVADAKYRAMRKWGLASDIPSLDNIASEHGMINQTEVPDDATKELPYCWTDRELQSFYPGLQADKTSEQNTDILVGYVNTDAAHWCRAQNISGVGALDLPNAYELMVIYLESDRLDALDPTASSYPQYMLGCKNPRGRFCPDVNNRYWASTEVSAERAVNVDNEGDLNINNGVKTGARGVLPVKEIW